MNKGKAALTGAASGAAAGAALGPWGAAAGGLIGGALGYFGADDSKAPSYTPDHQNFIYGLGGSDSYASTQSRSYDKSQAELGALATDAYQREALTQAMPDKISQVQSGGQGFLNGADSQARQQQLQALGGMQTANNSLNNFANRAQGPSAAQAQLQAGVDMAARQQYGMARSQPGGGGAALRAAAMNAAGISGNAGNQAAMLRAQEDQSFRGQQLQALGAAQQGAGQIAGATSGLRGQDQGFAQMQAGQANYDAGAANQFNQGQQQMQFNVGQNNLNAGIQSRHESDATTLAALGQSQNYEGLRNQVAGANTAQNNAFEGAKQAGAGLGAQNFNAATAQGNRETGMALGAVSAGAGIAGQFLGDKPSAIRADTSTSEFDGTPTSDIRAKKDIKPVSAAEALGGGDRTPQFTYTPEQTRALYKAQMAQENGIQSQISAAHLANARSQGPDRDLSEFGDGGGEALRQPIGLGKPGEARQERLQQLLALGANDRYHAAQEGQKPSTWGTGDIIPDMRPAQGYEYAYKDPERHGSGRYVGPMAQNLEHLPGVVDQGPDGTKSINAPRLTLANTAAVSDQQRRLDELERRQRLQALGFQGGQMPPIDTGALDQAYQQQMAGR
jgi:hypothetical protein